MARPPRLRSFLVGGVLLLVAVLLFQANTKDPSRLNAIDRALLVLTGTVERGFEACTRALGSTWSSYVALTHVRQDNEQLRMENGKLRALEASRQQLVAQSERYRRLLGLRAQLDPMTNAASAAELFPDRMGATQPGYGGHVAVAAHVVATDVHALFRTARIYLDRGEPEVEPNAAVISVDGVVGRVRRVAGRFCDVELVSDPQSRVDVVVARTGGRGMLRGGGSPDREVAQLDYLLRSDEARVGDVLVTSGLGGAFPPNLPVGTIQRVERGGSGLFQRVEVAPAVQFGRLQEVLVVQRDASRNPSQLQRLNDAPAPTKAPSGATLAPRPAVNAPRRP